MADTLSTVTAKVRAHLNDLDAQLYADSFLLTYVGMAQSEFDAWLRSKGIEGYRSQALVTVPAGTTALSTTTTPALPANFFQPIYLHERVSGSTKNTDWVAMTQIREDLPNQDAKEQLEIWAWQGGQILFVGATTARQIQVDYLTTAAEVALPGDPLPVPDSAEAIALLTAALVTHAAGEVEVGYGIHPGFRGRGLMTEALQCVTVWALAQPAVKRVLAESEPENTASHRVLEKSDFRPVSATHWQRARNDV